MAQFETCTDEELERMLQSEFLTEIRAQSIRAELASRVGRGQGQAIGEEPTPMGTPTKAAASARNEIDPNENIRERQGVLILIAATIITLIPTTLWWAFPLNEELRLQLALIIASWTYWLTLEPWLSGQFARPEHGGERKLSLGLAVFGSLVFMLTYWQIFEMHGGRFTFLTFAMATIGSMGLGLAALLLLLPILRSVGASAHEKSWGIALYRRGLLLPKIVALGIAFAALWSATG